MRCSTHVKQNIDFSQMANALVSSSEESDSDEVFKIHKSRRKGKSVSKSNKKSVAVVATPGSYIL